MHPILRQYFLIEEGKEEFYARLGLDVFEAPAKPKLVKKDDKTRKRRSNNIRNNGNGADNDSKS